MNHGRGPDGVTRRRGYGHRQSGRTGRGGHVRGAARRAVRAAAARGAEQQERTDGDAREAAGEHQTDALAPLRAPLRARLAPVQRLVVPPRRRGRRPPRARRYGKAPPPGSRARPGARQTPRRPPVRCRASRRAPPAALGGLRGRPRLDARHPLLVGRRAHDLRLIRMPGARRSARLAVRGLCGRACDFARRGPSTFGMRTVVRESCELDSSSPVAPQPGQDTAPLRCLRQVLQ